MDRNKKQAWGFIQSKPKAPAAIIRLRVQTEKEVFSDNRWNLTFDLRVEI
jgi:hypothetical protein